VAGPRCDAIVGRVTLGSRIRTAATSHCAGAQPRWCPLASRAVRRSSRP